LGAPFADDALRRRIVDLIANLEDQPVTDLTALLAAVHTPATGSTSASCQR